jgi:hypothetical protein
MNYTKPKTFVIHKNDAGTDAYRDQYVHALEAEIERLRAIVDKLPKCWRLNEQGQLVQDEPILSGMNVVTIRKTNAKIRTEEVGVLSVVACEDCGFDIVIRDGYGDEWYFKEEELYLTREAAEAAKEK